MTNQLRAGLLSLMAVFVLSCGGGGGGGGGAAFVGPSTLAVSL